MIEIDCPYPPKALNPNGRASRFAKTAAAKGHKKSCFFAALEAGAKGKGKPGKEYRLTYYAYTKTAHTHDDDNLITAMKYGRDAIAQAMGIDDKAFSLEPPVFQKAVKRPCVIVQVEEASA